MHRSDYTLTDEGTVSFRESTLILRRAVSLKQYATKRFAGEKHWQHVKAISSPGEQNSMAEGSLVSSRSLGRNRGARARDSCMRFRRLNVASLQRASPAKSIHISFFHCASRKFSLPLELGRRRSGEYVYQGTRMGLTQRRFCLVLCIPVAFLSFFSHLSARCLPRVQPICYATQPQLIFFPKEFTYNNKKWASAISFISKQISLALRSSRK